MEDCTPNIDDEETTTFTYSSQHSSAFSFDDGTSSYDDTRRNSSSSNGESEDSSDPEREYFPIMDLPVEVRCKILNMQNQRLVPVMRLVNRKWRDEVDQFYEFTLNVYDTTTNFEMIKKLRCRECTIWKLTQQLDTPTLFLHPAYLKVIKVYGPTSADNLKCLISASSNLEHLTLTRRANYPWFLNLNDTPALSNLQELRYLRLNSEEHISLNMRRDQNLQKPPMMDCYFPKLKHFEILKRFACWQYFHYVTCILQFIARHAKTLTNIEMDLIPLSCVAMLDDQEDSDDTSEDEDRAMMNPPRSPKRRRSRIQSISPDSIQLNELCKLRLQKFCVTTKGSDRDIFIWKSILEKQTELRELRFDWLCRDPRAEIRARISGFPWVHFQSPVEQCTETLVHVELASLSMFAKDFPTITNSRNISSPRVIPFDLGIFRNCRRLKSLILRCRENHAKLNELHQAQLNLNPDEVGLGRDLEDNNNGGGAVGGVGIGEPVENQNIEGQGQALGAGAGAAQEVLLMINGSDLPECLEQLEIFRFPMMTSEIVAMTQKVVNIRKLFLHECGKSGDFGVSANAIRQLAYLTNLKFLEVIGFNDSNGQRKQELEEVFQAIGIPYEGQDTWLEFSDGSTSAHESLKVLL